MNKLLILLFSLVFYSTNLLAQKNQAKKDDIKTDPKNKIKKFLQIDELNIPKSLSEIDFEIKQNTIDVVLNSPKYIFLTSKRDKVVNKNYKDYNSLKVTLKMTNSKSYVADIHLENWYSAKYDRKFQVILSKYNLLTDLRMGIYELLYGKVYVRKNREKLIQYSAIRIKKIRELSAADSKGGKGKGKNSGGNGKDKEEEDQPKEEKQKNKKDDKGPPGGDGTGDNSGSKGKEKEDKESIANSKKEEEKKKEEEEDPELAGNDDPKNKKKKKSEKEKLEDDDSDDIEQVMVPEEPPIPEKIPDPRIQAAKQAEQLDENKDDKGNYDLLEASDLFTKPINIFVNKLSLFSANLLYTSYSVRSSNYLLSTSLDMSFLRFGASINIIEEKVNPISYEFILLAGTSVENDTVQIPAWRTIEAKVSKYVLSNLFKFGVGLESSPYFFINLPVAGEGIVLYQNDIIYAKAYASIHLKLFRRELNIGGSYATSLSVSSTVENYDVSAIKSELFAQYFITKKYGVALTSEGYNFSGTDQGAAASSTGTNYSLNFITNFN